MNKKLTPIWDELSAIGEAAPPGTWDAVPANLSTNINQGVRMIEEEYQVALLMIRTALGLHRDSHDDLVTVANKLRAENEALKLAHARYECVRFLKPSQLAVLLLANLDGEGALDGLVDQLIKKKHLGGLQK